MADASLKDAGRLGFPARWIARGARRRLAVLALLACIVAGALVGWAIGRALVFGVAQSEIDSLVDLFADRTFDHFHDIRTVLVEANDDRLGRCSDDELLALRRTVFETPAIADMGRLRHGMLICTTGVGRLAQPVDQGDPHYVSHYGLRWYSMGSLLISADSQALVLELGNVNAVIEATVLGANDHPDILYTIGAVDHLTGQVIQAVGAPLPNQAATGLAAFSRSGTVGRIPDHVVGFACDDRSSVCVALTQPVTTVLQRNAVLLGAFAGMGSLIGIGVFLTGQFARRRDRSLSTKLRRAIKRDRLHVEYQPQLDLIDRRIVGVEALVRWTDADGTRHRPDVFVAVAENHGFISALTDLVIRHVVADMAELMRENPDLSVAINFAAADLTNDRLVARLTALAEAAGVPASRFSIELTERAAGHDPGIKAILAGARDLGHKVAIDDFGVGYSNLGYLQSMPIDYLKIDKSFTDTVGTGSVKSSIVPQILDMAKTLDFGIVVEGLETEEQITYFVDRGVRVGQGWAFARAMPIHRLRSWLHEWQAENAHGDGSAVKGKPEPCAEGARSLSPV